MTQRGRFDVTFNEKMSEIFDELNKIDGDSRTEIFRKAMLNYYYIKTQTPERGRFYLDLNAKMLEVFDELDKIDGDSKSEIFRKAMLTYYYLRKQTNKGSQILIKTKDSQEAKGLVLL